MLRNAAFAIFTAIWANLVLAQELLFCGEAQYSPASVSTIIKQNFEISHF